MRVRELRGATPCGGGRMRLAGEAGAAGRSRARGRAPAAGWCASTLLVALALGACQHSPGREMLTRAPPQIGAGDCPVVVRNSGIRRMEAYFHLGMESPPSDRRLWPRIGFLEPGESVQVNAICDEEYIRVTALVDRGVGLMNEWIVEERRLVEGREETIRLRDRGGR